MAKGLVIIYRAGGGLVQCKICHSWFLLTPPFTLTWFLLTPHPPLSSGMHETKSMYLSSQHVKLIDILFKVTLNLVLSCSSPRPCVDYCRIDIKVLGALNHFFFFSRLLFLKAVAFSAVTISWYGMYCLGNLPLVPVLCFSCCFRRVPMGLAVNW